MRSQQPGDILRCAVAEANPNDLRRCALQDAQAVKVFILGDQHEAALASQLPHGRISGTSSTDLPDVQRVRKNVVQQFGECLRQLLVEERRTALRGGNSQCSALALSGVRETGPNVVACELRKIG